MGFFLLRSSVASGGGGGESFDKYVSSSGNNGNPGTEAQPYATIAHALGQVSNGQSIGVLSNLTENINLSTISAGGSSSYKRVATTDAVRTISGQLTSPSGANKYITFEGLHWVSASEQQCNGVDFLKFIRCGFFGGPTSGNTATHLSGSNQLYEDCWFGGPGGRYASLCFERTGTLYRRCIVRTDTWGSPADDGNPNGGIQIYSSTGTCTAQQCIAVDCEPQRSNNEFLAAFPVTTNTGSANAEHIQCIARDNACPGIQIEGSNAATYVGTGNISVYNTWGFIENLDSSSGSITLTGGEYSHNTNSGVAGFGAETVSNTNLNTTSNGTSNYNGVSAGSGATTNALNMNTKLSAMKRRGVSGTLRGETGWDTEQAEDLFPLPYEDDARTFFAAEDTRGFCGGSFTLTSYLKR